MPTLNNEQIANEFGTDAADAALSYETTTDAAELALADENMSVDEQRATQAAIDDMERAARDDEALAPHRKEEAKRRGDAAVEAAMKRINEDISAQRQDLWR